MRTTSFYGILLTSFLASSVLLAIGCSQQPSDATSTEGSTEVSESAHNHGGWWCTEHGIPEEECSMCSTKAADDFKAKGDWCEEHNRAESQCFQCDPTRAEKFAKLYEAKFGHAPPEPTE